MRRNWQRGSIPAQKISTLCENQFFLKKSSPLTRSYIPLFVSGVNPQEKVIRVNFPRTNFALKLQVAPVFLRFGSARLFQGSIFHALSDMPYDAQNVAVKKERLYGVLSQTLSSFSIEEFFHESKIFSIDRQQRTACGGVCSLRDLLSCNAPTFPGALLSGRFS